MEAVKNNEEQLKKVETGILCKKCGERMRVWKTNASDNHIQRIRKCDECTIYRVTYER